MRFSAAADDIDETVAVIIFSILIVVFLGLAGLFVFLIVRLKRKDRYVIRCEIKTPSMFTKWVNITFLYTLGARLTGEFICISAQIVF